MTELQLQQVSAICRKYSVIELILFGSRAAGDARPDSDYDFPV
jgi:predicted nucleotidyltransferase